MFQNVEVDYGAAVAAADEPLTALNDEWFTHAMEKTNVAKTEQRDRANIAVDDRASEGDQTKGSTSSTQKSSSDPYQHITRATLAGAELDNISASGSQPSEVLQVTATDGKITSITVAERTAQLKTELINEMQAAKVAADAIRQTGPNSIEQLIGDNARKRDALCAELGIDKNTVVGSKQAYETLNPLFGSVGEDAQRKAKLEELYDLVQDRDQLEKLRHAPAYQRMTEAEFTAKGYMNANLALGAELPRQDLARAYELVKEAGRIDEELSHTQLYQTTELRVGLIYASGQQDRSVQILRHLQSATEKKSEPAQQEDELKKAVLLADKINVGFIAEQIRHTANVESGVSQELVDIISIGSQARIDYAKFLTEQGRFNEAQTFLTQAKADSPELIYQQDPVSKRIVYRDDSLASMDQKITLGVKTNPGSWDSAQLKFLKNLQNSEFGQAKENLAEMLRVTNLMRTEIEEANRPLKEERARLESKSREFQNKGQTITEEEKIESDRIMREMNIIDGTLAGREKQLNRQHNITRFMDGMLALSSEDKHKAHDIFLEVKKNDPDLANIKELGLDEKIKMTVGGLRGWWNDNYKKVAFGAAILAGVALAVGTCGVATGASAALIGGTASALAVSEVTAATIVAAGTVATATTLGALGGGLAHLGVERTVDKSAGWESFFKGAEIGGTTAGMVASPYAMAMIPKAAGAAGAVATAMEGANAAKNGWSIAGVVSSAKALIPTVEGLKLMAPTVVSGVGLSGAISGGKYLTGVEKNGLSALKEFGFKSLTNSLMFGVAGRIGIANEAAAVGKSSLSSALGVTKFSAIAGYGTSAVMEVSNVASNQKTFGEGARDFLINGTFNTVAIGLTKNSFGSQTVSRMANPFLQSLQFAAPAISFQESINGVINQYAINYMAHDINGVGAFARESDSGFIAPLFFDTVDRTLGRNHLNPNHNGERARIRMNLENWSNEFGQMTQLDRRFLDGRHPYSGIVFNVGEVPTGSEPTTENKQ